MTHRKRKLVGPMAPTQVTFEAHPEGDIHDSTPYIVAIIWFDDHTTVGMRFISPNHLAEFMSALMDKAFEVWPDDPLIRMAQED